jgi:hypothetical protein
MADVATQATAAVEMAAKRQQEIDTLKAETERLAPLADLGTKYRAALIEEVVTEGVRAFGNDFPAETERVLLAGASVEQLILKRDFNKGIAAQKLAGGRVTTDPDRDADSSTRRDAPPATPNAAYRA